jgi:beta-glucosidase
MGFNKDFAWGAAAAAYQIEGAAYEDGKGLSVWDMFCKIPGKVNNGDTGDIACDHYHHYKEDVALMKKLGLKAYRLSISWPRVMPDGTGRVNEKGLMFYDNLINEMLKNGIEPYVTLFHWDYPYELYKRGGWLNPDSPEWFAEYTKVIVDRFSDRVKNWMTINEPQCMVNLGHVIGVQAPGLKLGYHDTFQIIHNILLAHGKSAKVIRQYSKQPCQIGYAPVGNAKVPKNNTTQEIEAVRKSLFSVQKDNLWAVAWYMDPVYLGQYPEDGLKVFEPYLPKIKQDDMKIISEPLDFFGANIYFGQKETINEKGEIIVCPRLPGHTITTFDWTLEPSVLYWGPKFYYERYKKPILITENGMSNKDWVALDGKVHDPQRIDYMRRHLLQFQKACEEGVEAKGYLTWSLMDNFEWGVGYFERFGLTHVDYQTQKRTIKDSGYWYKKVIESNGDFLKEDSY